MSILIDGFRMPQKKNGFVVVIYPDGVCACEDGRIFDAEQLPPHGRLIDADALIVDLMDRGVEGLQTDDWHEIQQAVSDAPTVIEAEGKDGEDEL